MRGNRVPVVSVGMNVTHRTYGLGKVVGEWGTDTHRSMQTKINSTLQRHFRRGVPQP
jgi:hypothetical protein